MKHWRIKTKKDWIIFFICAALLVYGVVNGCFGSRIMHFMERFMPDKLTVMNQPGGYGTMIVTVLVMALLLLVLEHCNKKKKRVMWITVGTGLLISTALFCGYYVHGWLLVRQVYTTPAVSAMVTIDGNHMELQAGDERLIRLQELAADMKRLPKEEEKRVRTKDHGNSGNLDIVWINFPRRYFHSYDLIFRINADHTIFIGSGERLADYYEDNGIIDYLQSLAETK